MSELTYPVLHLRIKAMMLDSIMFAVMLFSIMILSIELGITDTATRLSFIAIPVILLEPVMIWLTGGSVGHHLAGIRVIGKDSGENLFILNGILRYAIKMVFGIYSLASMLITKQHQSIHDFLSNSVVVFKDDEFALPQHKLDARNTVYKSNKPSIWRRMVVIFAYVVIVLVTFEIIVSIFVSQECVNWDECTSLENNVVAIGGGISMCMFFLIILFGLFGKLPGAYYAGSKTHKN